MPLPFFDRLADAVRSKKTTLCVGLDPHFASLPAQLVDAAKSTHHQTADALADAIIAFNSGIIDAIENVAACVKPQIAFYERLGQAGWRAYEETLRLCRSKNLLVIADAKRGDIGTTAAAYSSFHLGLDDGIDGLDAFHADCLTVNPYMGFDTLDPFLKACETRGAGLFALVKTSNPGSGDFQDKTLDDGRLVYEAIADRINDYNATHQGGCGYGPVGMVVGATYPDQLSSLRKRCPATWILVPGYGAQGGTAADIGGAFDSNGLGAVVNSSRDILFAYRKKKLPDASYAAAANDAAQAAARDLNPFKKGTH